MKKIETLAIIGGGDLGQLIAHYALQEYTENVVFFDDIIPIGSSNKYGTIIGRIDMIIDEYNKRIFDELIIGIGYKHFKIREQLYNKLQNLPFATIIAKAGYIDKSVNIGRGSVILPGCVFDKNVEIGNNVFCNVGVTIAHDSKIFDHTFLAPNVSISGFVTVKERCMLGINSTIIDKIVIEKDIIIGAGAVVVKSLSNSGTYVGIPARRIR